MTSKSIGDEAIALHKKLHGKIIVKGKISVLKNDKIKLIYTP